jgi:hypothetical protein
MGPAVGKRALEIKAAITVSPRLRLSSLDRVTTNFL